MINIIKNKKLLYLIWASIMLSVILSPIISNAFIILAFMLCMIALFILSTEDLNILLMGIIPVAQIFKFTGEMFSIFTIFALLVVFNNFITKHDYNIKIVIPMLVFILFLLLQSLSLTIIKPILKHVINFLLIFYLVRNINKQDIVSVIYMLSIGIFITMLLTLNSSYFAKVENFLSVDFYTNPNNSSDYVRRNGGLIGDPNYCSMFLLMVLSLLMVMYYYNNIGMEFWFLAIPNIIIGFTTYSKSYFLVLATMSIIFIFFVLLPKHKLLFCLSWIVLIILFSMVLGEKLVVINKILERFAIGDFTTGRTMLNNIYLNYISSNPLVLLFGNNYLETRLDLYNNVHNIYIEVVYRMGILGTILYINVVIACLSNVNRPKLRKHFINYLPILVMLVCYIALAGIDDMMLPYYIIFSAYSIMLIGDDTDKLKSENCEDMK